MKTNFSLRHYLAVSAVSLGLVASAYAVTPRDDMPNRADAGMYQKHMAREMKDLARLHEELKLDAKQNALWQEAEKSIKQSRAGMRERFQKHQEEMRTMLNQPGADLHAVAKRMDDFKAESQKLRSDDRSQWLSVYDSLNAEQKEKVRLFFKSKLERMEKHHDKRGADRG